MYRSNEKEVITCYAASASEQCVYVCVYIYMACMHAHS